MRSLALPVALAAAFFCGCSSPTPDPDEAAGASQREAGSADESSVDLSIPELAPKPLVWIEDWSENRISPERQRARELNAMADHFKPAGRFDEAEEYYLAAMEADPTWSFPPYQLACNFELSGRHERALPQFAKAMELGFDDFPTALTDDELGLIRSEPEFEKSLMTIRERYISSGMSRVVNRSAFDRQWRCRIMAGPFFSSFTATGSPTPAIWRMRRHGRLWAS